MKITMDGTIAKLLDVEPGELFSLRGRDHHGIIHRGTEALYVITESGFLKALYQSEVSTAIRTGSLRHFVIARQEFHALCCGMLIVVRTPENRRQYVLGYGPKTHQPQAATQQSLF